jgi:hypothetical protein
MKLLLDECVPRPLKKHFEGHDVATIEQAGLKGLENGDLLRSACSSFDVPVTADKNIEYQQNAKNLPMAILILSAKSNRLEDLSPLIPKALLALDVIKLGEIITIEQ